MVSSTTKYDPSSTGADIYPIKIFPATVMLKTDVALPNAINFDMDRLGLNPSGRVAIVIGSLICPDTENVIVTDIA